MFDFLGVGAGPSALGPGAGSAIAFPGEVYETGLLDLTVPNLGVEIVPAKPGYIPIGLSPVILVEQVAGTQTTPMSSQAGSDSAHTNFVVPGSVAPTNASINACVGNTPAVVGGLSVSGNAARAAQHFTNAPIILDITAGAQGTGGFILKARLVFTIFWTAVG